MQFKKLGWFYPFLVLLLIQVGCQAPPCDDSDGVQLNIRFYKVTTTRIDSVLVDSIRVYSIQRQDSFLVNSEKGISRVSLPLSITSDSSTFVFSFKDKIRDTLTFKYTQETRLKSYECGFENFFEITSFESTCNLIDSLRVKKKLVEYGTDENIKIYF